MGPDGIAYRICDWIGVRYPLAEGERLLGENIPEALSSPAGHSWHFVLHSDKKTFGGDGAASLAPDELAGPVAAWLWAVEDEPHAGA